MKALNQDERNNLYLKFLLLFVITVFIAVFAIFFDYQLPAKLNQEQRQKLKLYNSFTVNQGRMMKLMDTLNYQIVELGHSNRGWEIQSTEISKQIDFLKFTNDTATNSLSGKLDKTFVNFLASEVKALKYKESLDQSKREFEQNEKLNKKMLEMEKAKGELSSESMR